MSHGNTHSLLFTCSVSIFVLLVTKADECSNGKTFKDYRVVLRWKIQAENHINTFFVIRLSVWMSVCMPILFFCVSNFNSMYVTSPYALYVISTYVYMFARMILYTTNEYKFCENIFYMSPNSITTLSPFYPRFFICVVFILLHRFNCRHIFFSIRNLSVLCTNNEKKQTNQIDNISIFFSFFEKQEKLKRSCNNLICVFASHTKLQN